MSNLTLNEVFGPQYQIAIGTNFNSNQTSTGTLDVRITVLEPVEAYRAIGYDGMYTQPYINSLSIYAGVTRIASVADDLINVIRSGLITEDTWNWTPNAPIFIAANGILTQTVPTAGNPVRRIGWAISSTKLNLDPYPIIGV